MQIKPHTPSAGGVILKDNKVLLIYSALRGAHSFPKGTIDPGESKEAAAVRELKEETGYDAIITDTIGDFTFEFESKDSQLYRKTVTYYAMELANDHEPQPNLQAGEDFVNVWVDVKEAYELLPFDDLKTALARAESL